MEREILVANTRTQKKYKLTADVTTLAELKAVLDTKGIDYEGMSFTEGISNVQLNDDSSQLPHDVNYKGQTTNNLVIILTNTTKNIASGAMSRTDLVNFIKGNNLGQAVKNHFGRNWTQVSTAELEMFYNNLLAKAAPKPGKMAEETPAEVPATSDYDDILASFGMSTNEKEEEKKETVEGKTPMPTLTVKDVAIDAICGLIRYFRNEDILNLNDLEDIEDEIEEALGY